MVYFRRLALVCLSLLLTTTTCKRNKALAGIRTYQESSDKPLANAFALKSPIAVYEKPDSKSKVLATLAVGVKVAVFASRVPDKAKPEEIFWYKIQHAPTSANPTAAATPIEGYVPEREEVLRDNFMVFKAADKASYRKEINPGKFESVEETRSAMATTAVNFRKSPAINSQVIRVIKNGEVLSVLEKSAKTYEIDKKHGHWYRLKSQNGEDGYAFGGYLVTGPASEMQQLEAMGFQFLTGWVTPLGPNAIVYASPMGDKRLQISENDYHIPEAWRSNGTLEQGIYYMVDAVTSKGNPPRYRLVVRLADVYDAATKEYYYYYVNKNKVEYVKDYYTVSEKLPHEFDAELAPQVNRFLGGNLNLQCSGLREFSGGPAGSRRQFKVIIAAIGPKVSGTEQSHHCARIERKTIIAEVINDKWVFSITENGEFQDLDGDQIPELISMNVGRGDFILEIHSIKQRRTELLAVLRNSEYEEGEYGDFKIDEKGFLHISASSNCTEKSSDANRAKECAAREARFRKTAKFLEFDTALPVFPFKGKLVGNKFVQVSPGA
ncbi:MAG: SH3 domain-containing protein [Turneriella sp.]|nr:SH3 domain-containing protein [Turneriella sp.]